MKHIEPIVEKATLAILKEELGLDNGPAIQFQQTRKDFEGQVTIVTFPYVKMLKKSPEDIGNILGAALKSRVEEVVDYNVVKGFLNLVIADTFWLGVLNDARAAERYGAGEKDSLPLVMVEYASPNTNKPLHLGHLRNIFLGWSVAQILDYHGHRTKKVQIINDRGIHICKSMYAWHREGGTETPERSGMKGDKLVGKYYVQFEKDFQGEYSEWLVTDEGKEKFNEFMSSPQAKKLEKQYEELQKSSANKEEKEQPAPAKAWFAAQFKIEFKNTFFNEYSTHGQGAKEMLRQWEEKDEEVYALWQKMNGWVYDGFAETFGRMGVTFDKDYYESDTYLVGKQKVMEGLEKGVFEQQEDGSIWVDLTEEKMDRKILLRSDGTAVYMTQDIGTAILRFEENPGLAYQIYTVGNEQDYHFKVLFKILAKLGYEWAHDCYHLSYGMVELPEGKMKSREGTVVDADELMEEMVHTAKEITTELGKLDGVSEEEKEALYEVIGLGALKYFLLKVDPKKGMLFDPKSSIDFAGNTAPFIQYSHARIRSILRRYDKEVPQVVDVSLLLHPMEREIITTLYQYPTVVAESAKSHSPALLGNYIYEVVKTFNTFYQAVPILIEENESVLEMRIALIATVADVIRSGMKMLGIDVPERM